jgi:hypothetical protein
MDEARATAAVDLVRRPHAEITLAFGGERVGTARGVAARHALERFAIEAGHTVHVEASGADDHHIAEAAYKALGQSFRQAVPRQHGHPVDKGRGMSGRTRDGVRHRSPSTPSCAGFAPIARPGSGPRNRAGSSSDDPALSAGSCGDPLRSVEHSMRVREDRHGVGRGRPRRSSGLRRLVPHGRWDRSLWSDRLTSGTLPLTAIGV